MSDEQIVFAGAELRELRGGLSTALSASSKISAMYEDGRVRPVAELNALVNAFDRFQRLMDKAMPFDGEAAVADESYPMPQTPADLAPAVEIQPNGESICVTAIYGERDRRLIAVTRNQVIAAAIARAWTSGRKED